MEREEIGSPGRERLFERLDGAVLEHAEEETVEHPRLADNVDETGLREAGSPFRAAKRLAPSRPHPRSPDSAGANMAIGPVAALVDRARDAVTRARSGG